MHLKGAVVGWRVVEPLTRCDIESDHRAQHAYRFDFCVCVPADGR
jgi:hypothetical protein